MQTLTKIRNIVIVAAMALGIASAQNAYAGPAWSIDTDDPFRNESWSFGDVFTVGDVNITVSALGAYDAGLDGFVSTSGILVGIFQESDGALLTSTSVLSGDPLIGFYRFHDISDITLLANTTYRVVAVNLDDLYNIAFNTPNNVDPLITWDRYGYCQTTTLTKCDDFTGTERTWMANFIIGEQQATVPEPATLGLLGLGLLGIGFARRRKH